MMDNLNPYESPYNEGEDLLYSDREVSDIIFEREHELAVVRFAYEQRLMGEPVELVALRGNVITTTRAMNRAESFDLGFSPLEEAATALACALQEWIEF